VDAACLILENNIRRLPVVEDGILTGLVTIADIVGAIGRLNITSPVSDYIGKWCVSVWSETPLCVVGSIMELADVKASSDIGFTLTLVGVAGDKDLISASIIEDKTEMSICLQVLMTMHGHGIHARHNESILQCFQDPASKIACERNNKADR